MARSSERRTTRRGQASPAFSENLAHDPTLNLPFPRDWAVDPTTARNAASRLIQSTSNLIPDDYCPNTIGQTPAVIERPTSELEVANSRSSRTELSITQTRVENSGRLTSQSSGRMARSRREMADPGPSRQPTSTEPRTSIEDKPRSRNTNQGRLSTQEMQQISAIVAQAFQNIQSELRLPSSSTEATTAAQTITTQAGFNAKSIGFFDPNSNKPSVGVKDNYNIFHNVYSFTQKLKVRATATSTTPLPMNVENCLLGAAERWFTEELDELSRTGLRYSPDIHLWCSTLESRFRDSPSRSLATLEQLPLHNQRCPKRKGPAQLSL